MPTNPSASPKPSSVPVTAPPPDALTYGFAELALFKQYDRESYRAAFGVEAAPYDAARLTKSWFDSTADTSRPDNVSIYRVLEQDSTGQWEFRQMVLPASEAATVNLPGAISYPPYVVPPSTATRGGSGINAIYLSLESDAHGLMTELGGTDLNLEELPGFAVTYPPQEPRRLWYFLLGGRPCNVGALLYNRNENGVGAPGQWNVSAGAPVWVPAALVTGENDTRAPREMPVRDLYPNEVFQAGLMGTVIVRTDWQDAAEQEAGKFTPQDRATLQLIYQTVMQLAEASPPAAKPNSL